MRWKLVICTRIEHEHRVLRDVGARIWLWNILHRGGVNSGARHGLERGPNIMHPLSTLAPLGQEGTFETA